MTALVAVVAALAVYRLSLLVTADKVTEAVRGRLAGELGDVHPKLRYWVSCPWCVSMWAAPPVLWSAWCFGDRGWWFVPAAALAASAVTGFLASYAAPET